MNTNQQSLQNRRNISLLDSSYFTSLNKKNALGKKNYLKFVKMRIILYALKLNGKTINYMHIRYTTLSSYEH